MPAENTISANSDFPAPLLPLAPRPSLFLPSPLVIAIGGMRGNADRLCMREEYRESPDLFTRRRIISADPNRDCSPRRCYRRILKVSFLSDATWLKGDISKADRRASRILRPFHDSPLLDGTLKNVDANVSRESARLRKESSALAGLPNRSSIPRCGCVERSRSAGTYRPAHARVHV